MASGLKLSQPCQGLYAGSSHCTRAGTSGRRAVSYVTRALPSVHRRCLPPAIRQRSVPVPFRRHHWVRAQMEEQEQEGTLEMDEQCELVNGSEVRIGELGAYFVQALKNNNGLGVLVLSDVLGYQNADTRDFVNELACFGYNVLLPDLFRGVPWTDARGEGEYEQWRSLHPPQRVEEDIDAAAAWLNQELVGGSDSPDKLSLVGFCFGGGRLVETLARDEKGLFGAAAFFYGTRFDPALASRIRIPLLLVVGDSDPKCTVETIRQLEHTVVGSVAKVYEGAGHAFAHRPSSFADDAHSVDAITSLRQWLHDHLDSPATQDDQPDVEVVGEQGLNF